MDPLILITGASRGIGAATARLAAARGYAVGVNFVRDEAAARGICDQIETADGRACHPLAAFGRGVVYDRRLRRHIRLTLINL